MSTINTNVNSTIWGVQNSNQTTAAQTQSQPRVHHHHHKNNTQDSVQLSEEGQQEATNKPKGPLDSLVSNGTITQAQEDAIRNAFISAREANKAGTYTSNPTSPLSSLVANNTITQAQADSITTAFKARVQPAEGNNETAGVQGQHRTHHHHHAAQQTQDAVDPNEALTQTTGTTDSLVNELLESTESQTAATLNQEQEE